MSYSKSELKSALTQLSESSDAKGFVENLAKLGKTDGAETLHYMEYQDAITRLELINPDFDVQNVWSELAAYAQENGESAFPRGADNAQAISDKLTLMEATPLQSPQSFTDIMARKSFAQAINPDASVLTKVPAGISAVLFKLTDHFRDRDTVMQRQSNFDHTESLDA